jgi:Phosphoadenosine phosphosulfate reductase family
MRIIVNFSGGVGSFIAAKLAIEKYGSGPVNLLFADTKMEDEDLYRFNREAVKYLNVPISVVEDGRTPWEVFNDHRYLGNSRIDPCSRILKRELLRAWIEKYIPVKGTKIVLGIDFTEVHRLENARPYWQPYELWAPLCDTSNQLWWKPDMIKELERIGIRPPRLYEMGFPHNNCGGFCIKAGQAQFRLLLEKMPERYAYHEDQEARLQAKLGKPVTILRKQENGVRRNLSLRELRESIEYDKDDWGGCGCAID